MRSNDGVGGSGFVEEIRGSYCPLQSVQWFESGVMNGTVPKRTL